MSIMVEEEVKIVRFESNGNPVMGRPVREGEIETRLRQRTDPGIEDVRGLTGKEARAWVHRITSAAHGEITGPRRRKVEKELQKPR